MQYVGSVSVLIQGKLLNVPVLKVDYQNEDSAHPAGGVTEAADGSLEIILDARLPEEQAKQALEGAAKEISRRLLARSLN